VHPHTKVKATMEAIGETLENVGLAQEIQKGLAPSLMTAAKFDPAATEAMKAEIGGKGVMEIYNTKLGNYCLREWAAASSVDLSAARRRSSAGTVENARSIEPTEAGLTANWEAFKSSPAFEVLCKYLAYKKTILSESVNAKLFYESRPLGRGAFGAVFLTFKKDSGQPLATKKMFKVIAKKNKMLKDCLIEREVLAKVASPFCVNIHYAYHDQKEMCLVITLCPGGDLGFLLQSRYSEAKKGQERKFEKLPAGAVKFYAASMALGLQAIHSAGYVYRDLKPQNVLLDIDGKVRISDMGLTANITGGPIKQCSGTRGYWSPETIKKEPYTIQPDWWSLGVTLYVLESDKLPFKGKTDEEKDEATKAGEIDYKHDEPEDLQALISALCTIDQTKRLGCTKGVEDLKAHAYFKGFEWSKLEAGAMEVPIKPNPNDINAPSKKDIDEFKPPKDVSWDPDDEKMFDKWTMVDGTVWEHEACFRIAKKKEIGGGGGGGGGCCTIA